VTSTVEPTETTEIPEYPAPRAEGCPFDPAPRTRALQQEGPLTRVRLWDGTTPWLATRFDTQRTLLSDPRISSDISRPGYPSGAPLPPGGSQISFILMDDPEHARLRRMVTAPFAIKRVAAMRPAIQQIVDDQLAAMLAGPNPTDLVTSFALPVPSLVICELLGVPYADHDFFQANSKVIINRGVTQEERQQALGRLLAYLDELMGRKLVEPAEDLLSGLGERINRGEMTQHEAAQMGVLLLIAGHETTANMIALGTALLLEHPDQLALLRDSEDPKLVNSAVEEMLRYLTIVHNGRRRVAVEDIEIEGQTIRAGEGVIMPSEIGNRDEAVFPDPDTLDLSRDARRHVAFGFGVHQCLGQPLARLELQIVYSTLYRRVPTLALATDLDKVPFKHDGSVYGVYELPVTW
jgi:cytochrome P450